MCCFLSLSWLGDWTLAIVMKKLRGLRKMSFPSSIWGSSVSQESPDRAGHWAVWVRLTADSLWAENWSCSEVPWTSDLFGIPWLSLDVTGCSGPVKSCVAVSSSAALFKEECLNSCLWKCWGETFPFHHCASFFSVWASRHIFVPQTQLLGFFLQ